MSIWEKNFSDSFTPVESFSSVFLQVLKKRHPSDEDGSPGPRRKRISTDSVESDSTTVLS